jgi:uncharacterized protein
MPGDDGRDGGPGREETARYGKLDRGKERAGLDAPTAPGATMGHVNDAPQVTDNQAESRFEIRADGYLAELDYRLNGKRLVLIHTETPVELEGRGLGGRLVAAALDRAKREGLTVVPLCPFARGWLERHTAEAAGIAVDWGRAR